MATCDTLLRCRGRTGEQAWLISDFLAYHSLGCTAGALSLQRRADIFIDLLHEALGGVAGEPSAAVWLVEAGIAFERLGLTLLLVGHEGLSAALPSIGWHIFVRVVF